METPVCELCGASSSETVVRQKDLLHRVTDEPYSIVRCEACGFLYLSPRPAEHEIGRFYPETYYAPPAPPRRFSGIKRWVMEDYYGYPPSKPRGFLESIRKVLLYPEMLRRRVTGRRILPWVGGGKLLDVGCGHGVSAAMLAQQGWDVYGLDFSQVAAGHARALLGGDRVHVGDLYSAKYPDRLFDVVLMSHSLEHLYHPKRVLAEVRRILKDQGVLMVAVPNAASWEASLCGRWWGPWDPPRHLYHFTRESLTRLLRQTGFSVDEITTGVTAAHLTSSVERAWTETKQTPLPLKRALERWLFRPFSLTAGNLGHGTELLVRAVKSEVWV
jgi:SAM-dependent methyltransferase